MSFFFSPSGIFNYYWSVTLCGYWFYFQHFCIRLSDQWCRRRLADRFYRIWKSNNRRIRPESSGGEEPVKRSHGLTSRWRSTTVRHSRRLKIGYEMDKRVSPKTLDNLLWKQKQIKHSNKQKLEMESDAFNNGDGADAFRTLLDWTVILDRQDEGSCSISNPSFHQKSIPAVLICSITSG